jgi:hypothetical protein
MAAIPLAATALPNVRRFIMAVNTFGVTDDRHADRADVRDATRTNATGIAKAEPTFVS